MANVVEKIQLICVEQGATDKEEDANHNKMWRATLTNDHSVFVEWGRVGANKVQNQTKDFGSESQARAFIAKKRREKEKKNYAEIEVVSDAPTITSVSASKSPSNLKAIAKSQIRHSNPLTAELLDFFAKENAHQITSATKGAIQYNDTTGLFSTPLGIVGQSNIDQANNILVDIGDVVAKNDHDNPKLMELSQKYLRYIPTDIGMKRFDPHMFWRSLPEVQQQKQIVDALQASLVSATTTPQKKSKTSNALKEKVFDVQLDLVEDKKKITSITNMYNKSKGNHNDVKRFKVKRIYSVNIASERKYFKLHGAKMDNIWNLWHGTASSNCLSIMKQGLIIPPSSSSHCTGRLYGDGVYGSDMSTKALRYATSAWGGKASSRTFMFIMDMAMGSYYEPKQRSYMSTAYPVKGHDSTFAKAGIGGVSNNEMIAYNTNQVQLKYLVEFSDK
tara:strand:- start:4819 stop:6159 length:1341 start_codon:yes stop_codon:yes gene_type:complete